VPSTEVSSIPSPPSSRLRACNVFSSKPRNVAAAAEAFIFAMAPAAVAAEFRNDFAAATFACLARNKRSNVSVLYGQSQRRNVVSGKGPYRSPRAFSISFTRSLPFFWFKTFMKSAPLRRTFGTKTPSMSCSSSDESD